MNNIAIISAHRLHFMSRAPNLLSPLLILSGVCSIEVGMVSRFPSPAQDYQQIQIDLNKILVKDRDDTFVLRVYGDSMEGAGIYGQDEIIVDRSIRPQAGKVIVASLGGEFTVKRLGVDRYGNGWLLSGNPEYPAMPVSPESVFSILGVVMFCVHHTG